MPTGAYYNEIEPYAAEWLKNLISKGLVAPGDVDTRSIVDVRPSDLIGYTQCHFFAGIGLWSLALRVAGWPDSRPVWTGSCPCQPFSVAGSKKGFADERDLWPQFHGLIEKRLPPVVFGEQSANAAEWLNRVRGNLEAVGYAVGAIPVEAASAGADHYRDRFWFVADYDLQCPGEGREQRSGQLGGSGSAPQDHPCTVPNGDGQRLEGDQPSDPTMVRRRPAYPGRADPHRALVDRPSIGWGEGWTEHEFRSRGFTAAVAGIGDGQFIECPDGKWRRLPPPGVRWLGTGVPARVAKLRAIGNAIDWRPASEVIRAYLDARP